MAPPANVPVPAHAPGRAILDSSSGIGTGTGTGTGTGRLVPSRHPHSYSRSRSHSPSYRHNCQYRSSFLSRTALRVPRPHCNFAVATCAPSAPSTLHTHHHHNHPYWRCRTPFSMQKTQQRIEKHSAGSGMHIHADTRVYSCTVGTRVYTVQTLRHVAVSAIGVFG